MKPSIFNSLYAKKYIYWLFIGGVVLVLGIVIGRAVYNDPNADPNQKTSAKPSTQEIKPVMSVEAIYPTVSHINHDVIANGLITGQSVAEVGAKVSGMAIDKVLVDVGDVVQEGQILATLDGRKVMADVVASEADIASAHANLEKANSDLARVTPLVDIGAISREQYDAYQTRQINAQAALESAKARAYSNQITQSQTAITAPVAGIISQNNANVGMMTTGTTLFSILKNGLLQWQAAVAGHQIHRIGIGQKAVIQSGDSLVQGQVTHISPVANATGEITVFVAIDEPAYLRSGMYTSGRFITDTITALTLPINTITTTDGYDYVWVLSQTSKTKPNLNNNLYYATRQPLNVLYRDDQVVAVDLPQHSLIIKSGGNFLNDGDIVRLVNFPSMAQ